MLLKWKYGVNDSSETMLSGIRKRKKRNEENMKQGKQRRYMP